MSCTSANASSAWSIARQSGVGASGAILSGIARFSASGSWVNDSLMVTSWPKAPTRATSSGRSRPNNCAPAARSSGRLPSMLPETSSMTIIRIGWGRLSNWVIACGLPSSRSSNWSWVRLVTSLPSRSVTVANTRTASLPARKVGCCAPAATTAPAIDAASSTRT